MTLSRRALLAALASAACSHPSRARRVAVAAASDLRFALADILTALRATEPHLAVEVSYGASGSLVAQITQGAPFDVFLSADVALARDLCARGLADPRSLFLYARGHLALFTALPPSSLDLSALGLRALLDPAARRVAIANPAHAPYGRAAVAAITRAGLTTTVAPKLVTGENVAQALQMAQSGAADVALVALSLTHAPAVRTAPAQVFAVPAELHPPIEQGGVTLRRATDTTSTAIVTRFLQSPAARAILRRHGFDPWTGPPSPSASDSPPSRR
jgi:molybdate transport system substrate-binding protein